MTTFDAGLCPLCAPALGRGADPLRIPDDVWSDVVVRDALTRRDVGALFRRVSQLTGGSQTRIGAAVGLEQGYVSRVMAGRKVTSIDVLERIAEGCRMPDQARMALGLAPAGPVMSPGHGFAGGGAAE